jgi:signal transduction histidine kinase
MDILNEFDLELVSAETQNKLNFMSVQYDLARKEANIKDLENRAAIQRYQVKFRDTLLISISALIIIMAFLTVIYIRYMKRKRQLVETRVKQLEQEKQLVATQALLDGETAERTRLARDLHDGLGGMLTGVKMRLQEMKKSVIIESSDVESYNKAMDLLDESVSEMRRVSHNLMPDSLSRFGLKPAVDDFCRSLSSAIIFNFYGSEIRLEPKLEALIYRCIHELVNNAMKYSGALQIMVQIMQESDRIAFTVQDDGCGFDPSAETKGAGLKNIRTRVTSFGGNLMIDSKADKGTEVNVELKIQKDMRN